MGSCYQQAWNLRAKIIFTNKVAIRKYFHLLSRFIVHLYNLFKDVIYNSVPLPADLMTDENCLRPGKTYYDSEVMYHVSGIPVHCLGVQYLENSSTQSQKEFSIQYSNDIGQRYGAADTCLTFDLTNPGQ